MQVALIIEALALEFTLDVSSLAFLSGASGKKKPNIEVKVVDPPSSGGLRAYPNNRVVSEQLRTNIKGNYQS